MRRTAVVIASLCATALAAHVACGNGDHGGSAEPDASGDVAPDVPSDVEDAADPRCATRATFLGTHPHASQQPTPLGRTISDVRGWNGLLYFGYGDIEANTGPIYLTSFDPKSATWQEHPVSYVESGTGVTKSAPYFASHDIERSARSNARRATSTSRAAA